MVDVFVFVLIVIFIYVYPYIFRNTILNNSVSWSILSILPMLIYFGFRKKKNWKKIIVGSLIFGALFGISLEFFAQVAGIWMVPQSIFSVRIFGVSTIDALIGYIPMTLLVLVFYEHFFDNDTHNKISPHIWRAIIPGVLGFGVILFLYSINPSIFLFKNPYLIIGLIAIIPTIVQSIKSPKLFSRYARVSVSLFFVFFILEIVGLSNNWWIFHGSDYMGVVNFNGLIFPLEEIFFWMLLYPPTICAYYEEFVK